MAWPRGVKYILARLLLLTMSLVIVVVASEFLLRLVAPQPKSWIEVYRSSSSPPYCLERNVRSRADSGETKWIVFTDDAGRRTSGGPRPEKTSGAPDALVLGDSFTFGHGVDYEESFVGILDRSEGRYRFLNSGVPGYGPTQYREVLEQAIGGGAPPRLVIVASYLGNDFYDCIWDKHVPVRNRVVGDPGGGKSWMKRHSHLYRLLAKVWHLASLGGGKGIDQVEVELYDEARWKDGKLEQAAGIYEAEFRRIASLCRREGIPLRVCIIPTATAVEAAATNSSGTAGTSKSDYKLPARKACSILESLDIPYIDTTTSLAKLGKSRAYFRYDTHLTPQGNRIVADAIRAHLPDAVEIPSEVSPPAPPIP